MIIILVIRKLYLKLESLFCLNREFEESHFDILSLLVIIETNTCHKQGKFSNKIKHIYLLIADFIKYFIK